jgi:hypothetical protein
VVASFVELVNQHRTFQIMPRVESLAPLETPDDWRPSAVRDRRVSFPEGR